MNTQTVLFVCVLALASSASDNEDWYKSAVVYRIYPRSFQDSDGDGIGDLQGILSHIDYLVELGIDAVCLSSIYPSPNKDFGYDVSNYLAVNSEFGTMEDFEYLVEALEDSGIKLILDFVPNHTSNKHEWFIESEKADDNNFTDFYVWKDASTFDPITNMPSPPNNWVSYFDGSMWTWSDTREQYYLHQFLEEQPDLNYMNSDVLSAMKEALLFWLEKGAKGFVMSAAYAIGEDKRYLDEPLYNNTGCLKNKTSYGCYNHTSTMDQNLTFSILRQFRQVIDGYSNETDNFTRIILTENLSNRSVLYYGNESDPIATFPLNTNFFHLNKNSTAGDWLTAVESEYDVVPSWAWANFVLGDHNHHRVTSRFTNEFADLATMLQMTLKGTAVTYFGEELGLQDSWIRHDQAVDPQGLKNPTAYKFLNEYSRDPERAPFPWNTTVYGGFTNGTPWLPPNTGYWQVNVASQKTANISHLKIYKALVKLRKFETLKDLNSTCSVTAANKTIITVFRALTDNPTIVTVLNFGELTQSVNLTSVRSTIPSEASLIVASLNFYSFKGITSMTTTLTFNTSKIILPPLTGIILSTYTSESCSKCPVTFL